MGMPAAGSGIRVSTLLRAVGSMALVLGLLLNSGSPLGVSSLAVETREIC